MHGAVIFLGDPCLGGKVQLLEGEVRFALEHGEETPLDAAPYIFLFPIDVHMDSSPYARVCRRVIYVLIVR